MIGEGQGGTAGAMAVSATHWKTRIQRWEMQVTCCTLYPQVLLVDAAKMFHPCAPLQLFFCRTLRAVDNLQNDMFRVPLWSAHPNNLSHFSHPVSEETLVRNLKAWGHDVQTRGEKPTDTRLHAYKEPHHQRIIDAEMYRPTRHLLGLRFSGHGGQPG